MNRNYDPLSPETRKVVDNVCRNLGYTFVKKPPTPTDILNAKCIDGIERHILNFTCSQEKLNINGVGEKLEPLPIHTIQTD